MSRPWEWQAAGTQLHAIPAVPTDTYPPLPGDEFTALCGVDLVLVRDDFRRHVRRETCPVCTKRYVDFLDSQQRPAARAPRAGAAR